MQIGQRPGRENHRSQRSMQEASEGRAKKKTQKKHTFMTAPRILCISLYSIWKERDMFVVPLRKFFNGYPPADLLQAEVSPRTMNSVVLWLVIFVLLLAGSFTASWHSLGKMRMF